MSNVLIATPIMDGRPEWRFVAPLTGTMQALGEAGHTAGFATVTTDSHISRARCTLQAQMLADPGWSHLMWIDSDIEFAPESVLRLLAHDVDVVAGAYPLKGFPVSYAVNAMEGAETTKTDAGTLVPMNYVSTGFMLVKRRALEAVNAAHPELKVRLPGKHNIETPPGSDKDYRQRIEDNYFATWDCALVPHPDGEGQQWLTEDWGWCQRYRDLGGNIWLDPEIALNHVGKCAYPGDTKTLKAHVEELFGEKADG